MIMQNARIFVDEAPWLPIYPARILERKEVKIVDENELRKAIGDELFDIVKTASTQEAV